jgi:hypothetical protein
MSEQHLDDAKPDATFQKVRRQAVAQAKATARNKCFNPTARSSAVRLRGRSLLTGKKTGNLADSGVFCENPHRKHVRIQ